MCLREDRVIERLLTVVSIVAMCTALLMGLANEAEAHAVIVASDPAEGSELQQPPTAVVLTFTEEIDVGVSSVQVLDTAGRSVVRRKANLAEQDPRRLQVALVDLEEGVYTVTWRVLSRVDGHVTGGAFAFGVGVSPGDAVIPTRGEVATPNATPLSVTSRALLYLGLVLIFGASTAVAAVFSGAPKVVFRVAAIGWLSLLVAVGLFAESLRADTGATYPLLVATNAGRGLIWRFGVLTLTGGALLAARRWRGFWWVVIAGALTFSATHVSFGHAGAGTLRIGKIVTQTVHISAVSVWIGGLATLLLGIRAMDSQERSRVVKRFSTVAAIGLAAVAVTGALRAFSEVGTLGRLTSTGYGRAVLIKIALLPLLALLGAVNRYRNVPRAGERPRGLRRVGSAELAVALIVLVVTGVLTSLAPARLSGSAAAQPERVLAEGADFATTVRARLEVSPGRPGPNRFTLRIRDYDSNRPIEASRAALSFRYPVPDLVEPSTLELQPATAGVYRAIGPNIALGGPWLVDVLIVRENTSTQLTLTVATVSGQKVDVVTGDPTLYTVTNVTEGSVQLYVDPAIPGRNEVHATYFDKQGAELPGLSDAVLMATPDKGEPRTLAVKFLGPGHFVAAGELSQGRWRFDAIANGPDGDPIHVYFKQTIGGRQRR